MKIKVQRLVKVWVEEGYDVKDISEETLNSIINYEESCYDVDTLWDTQEELGPVTIYDEKWNIIKSIE